MGQARDARDPRQDRQALKEDPDLVRLPCPYDCRHAVRNPGGGQRDPGFGVGSQGAGAAFGTALRGDPGPGARPSPRWPQATNAIPGWRHTGPRNRIGFPNASPPKPPGSETGPRPDSARGARGRQNGLVRQNAAELKPTLAPRRRRKAARDRCRPRRLPLERRPEQKNGYSANASRHRRHACALHILEATGDIRKVSLWLGHASIKSTEIYLRVDPAEKLGVLAAGFPPIVRKGSFKDAPDKLMAILNDARVQ